MIDDMKKILLFALSLLTMCFASCEKDNENSNNAGNGKLIKTISGYATDFDANNGLCISTFEYDAQHRITKVIVSGYNEMYTYEYNGSEIIEKFWYAESEWGFPFNESEMISGGYVRYVLNDDGYLSRKEEYTGLDEQLYRTSTYIYDNGLLKKSITDNSDESTRNRYECSYEWSNNDITRSTYIDHAYNSTYLTTYTYGNEDKGNIMGWYCKDSPWQQIDGMPDTYLVFKGMKNKHLIKSMTKHNSSGSIDSGNSRNFYYQFDADGYVIETSLEQGGTVASYNISTVAYY